MLTINFDPNDRSHRQEFLEVLLPVAVNDLDEHSSPHWGNLTAQHMAEHLLWAYEISLGRTIVECSTPERFLERARRFLFSDNPTPRGYKNPALGELPPPLRLAGLEEAKSALKDVAREWLDYYRENPRALHVNPIFGPLDGEQWHRAHYKHCIHHLLQFGVIEQKVKGE